MSDLRYMKLKLTLLIDIVDVSYIFAYLGVNVISN